jgi:hypothetical protein
MTGSTIRLIVNQIDIEQRLMAIFSGVDDGSICGTRLPGVAELTNGLRIVKLIPNLFCFGTNPHDAARIQNPNVFDVLPIHHRPNNLIDCGAIIPQHGKF